MFGINEIVKQAQAAESLLERAERACAKTRGLRGGDRTYTPLIAAAIFPQGSAAKADLVFNVPADADFWAYKLLMFPQCRVVDPAGGTPDEVTFRATSFSGESGSTGIAAAATRYSDFNTIVDGTFALIFEGRELHNVDTPLAATYCASTGKWLTGGFAGGIPPTWSGANPTPGGMVFDVPFFIPRTKSLTCRVSPTHLGVRTIDTRRHEYRIVGILEGEKKVSAFR